jgi:hypothetical protein
MSEGRDKRSSQRSFRSHLERVKESFKKTKSSASNSEASGQGVELESFNNTLQTALNVDNAAVQRETEEPKGV